MNVVRYESSNCTLVFTDTDLASSLNLALSLQAISGRCLGCTTCLPARPLFGYNMHFPGKTKINSWRAKVTVTHSHTSHDKPVRKNTLLPYLLHFLSSHSVFTYLSATSDWKFWKFSHYTAWNMLEEDELIGRNHPNFPWWLALDEGDDSCLWPWSWFVWGLLSAMTAVTWKRCLNTV